MIALSKLYRAVEQSAAFFPENALHVTMAVEDVSENETEKVLHIGNCYGRMMITERGTGCLMSYDEQGDVDGGWPIVVEAVKTVSDNPLNLAVFLSAFLRLDMLQPSENK